MDGPPITPDGRLLGEGGLITPAAARIQSATFKATEGRSRGLVGKAPAGGVAQDAPRLLHQQLAPREVPDLGPRVRHPRPLRHKENTLGNKSGVRIRAQLGTYFTSKKDALSRVLDPESQEKDVSVEEGNLWCNFFCYPPFPWVLHQRDPFSNPEFSVLLLGGGAAVG